MKPDSRDLLLTWLAQWLARSKRHAHKNFALLIVTAIACAAWFERKTR